MELLYGGFDGLDVSFKARMPLPLCAELEKAKEAAQRAHSDVLMVWNGVRLLIGESGAKGGYAFRASTGEFGETWFFKKPNIRDPWSVRASTSSFQLAMNGLATTAENLTNTLDQLGIESRHGDESIGRVDYCLDFLIPGFSLEPNVFVMHSNSIRNDWVDISEMGIHGTSGRTTSVTIGKMPNRQVIVYDKTAEIIAHNKPAWLAIWNATRERAGQPPLDQAAFMASRVWRVELRAGKRLLKDGWAITTWADLRTRFGDLIASIVTAVRHTTPTDDSNRSRWPNSPLWNAVSEASDGDLFELRNYALPNLVRTIQVDAFCDMLKRQIEGLTITQAAVKGVPLSDVPSFAAAEGVKMAKRIAAENQKIAEKYMKSASRYRILTSDR